MQNLSPVHYDMFDKSMINTETSFGSFGTMEMSNTTEQEFSGI